MCTGIRVKADNGAVIYGRTLEFAKDIESKIIMLPRNTIIQGTAQEKNKGLTWKSKYAVLGANASGKMHLVDGVNEASLAGGLFYFPGYAQYQEPDGSMVNNIIAPWEILTWILTNFSNITQIKESLPNITVGNIILKEWGIIPPIHVVIHDIQGNCIVIEYINGSLVIYDNSIGVITNAPDFNWHITNLKNYINLSPFNIEETKIGQLKLKPLSQGSGLHGLPGDFTSPSRFIRAALLSQNLVNIENEEKALNAALHVLNIFDIPLGAVREKSGNKIYYEYSQWTSLIDSKNKRFYWRTYNNYQIYMADLMQLDLNAEKPVIIEMERK